MSLDAVFGTIAEKYFSKDDHVSEGLLCMVVGRRYALMPKKGKKDYPAFMDRLGDLLIETKTLCYACALIPNHFHRFAVIVL